MPSRFNSFHKSFLALIFFLFASTGAQADPRIVVVFDLDHTLINTNYRIVAISHEIGRKLGIPKLASMEYGQVESLKAALKKWDFSKFGLTDPVLIKKAFGDGTHAGLKKSEFGKIFYGNPKFLRYDGVIAGAPEFVIDLAEKLNADILYLTGRTKKFKNETLRQLVKYKFPIDGKQAKLVLKPNNYKGSTEDYKDGILAKYNVVIVFDDSSRNVNKLRKSLPPETIIVRVTPDVLNTEGLEQGIIQISDYTNKAQMKRLIHQAYCASLLLGRG